MENSKLFTSINNKKGVLLQVEEGNLSVSVWKKETPILTTLDRDSAMEICEFIASNLKPEVDEEENQRKINFWSKTIDDARNWQAEDVKSDEEN